MIYAACANGNIRFRQLAKILGISVSTLQVWLKTYPDFSAQRQLGILAWDDEILHNSEKSLLKRIKGGRYTERTREPGLVLDKKNPTIEKLNEETGEIETVDNYVAGLLVTKTVSKVLAPDPKSIFYALENRDPERWKNLKSIEVSGHLKYGDVKDRLDEIRSKADTVMEAIIKDAASPDAE